MNMKKVMQVICYDSGLAVIHKRKTLKGTYHISKYSQSRIKKLSFDSYRGSTYNVYWIKL